VTKHRDDLPDNEGEPLDLIRKSVSEAVNHILDQMEAREMVNEAIRLHEQDLEEMTTTSATPGYLTPKAFQGPGPEGKKLIKKVATDSTGWMHTEEGLDDVARGCDKLHREDDEDKRGWENISEGRSRYHELRSDQNRTAKKKIADEVSSVKRALRGIHSSLKLLRKYKTEEGHSGESFWKRTQNDIYKMDELLLRISDSLREIRK